MHDPSPQPRVGAIPARGIITALVIAAIVALSSSAAALFAPLEEEGRRTYITRGQSLQVALVQVDVTPAFDPMEQLTRQNTWRVRGEILLRNVSGDPQELLLGFNSRYAEEGSLQVLVDGVSIEGEARELHANPLVEVARFSQAEVFGVRIESNQGVNIGVEYLTRPRRDERGQSVFSLPTHLLSLLAQEVDQAYISMDFNQLPVGLASTLSGFTIWNQPWQRLTWYAIEWQPRLALQVAWMQPWVLLVSMADIEECPSPLEVVQRMSQSDPASMREYLSDWENSELQFCSSLPLAIHGYSFSSERVRQQFADIQLNRYLGTSADRGSIYRENPNFDPELHLSDAEALYWRTLQRFADAR